MTALAADLASVAAAVDTTSIRVRAPATRADALAHPGDGDLESFVAALAAEIASSDRLHALVASLDRNLHRLVAQLNDAVNQAIAVAFGSTRYADLRSLVEQLEALREALPPACRWPSRAAHWRPIDSQRRPARRVVLNDGDVASPNALHRRYT